MVDKNTFFRFHVYCRSFMIPLRHAGLTHPVLLRFFSHGSRRVQYALQNPPLLGPPINYDTDGARHFLDIMLILERQCEKRTGSTRKLQVSMVIFYLYPMYHFFCIWYNANSYLVWTKFLSNNICILFPSSWYYNNINSYQEYPYLLSFILISGVCLVHCLTPFLHSFSLSSFFYLNIIVM